MTRHERRHDTHEVPHPRLQNEIAQSGALVTHLGWRRALETESHYLSMHAMAAREPIDPHLLICKEDPKDMTATGGAEPAEASDQEKICCRHILASCRLKLPLSGHRGSWAPTAQTCTTHRSQRLLGWWKPVKYIHISRVGGSTASAERKST